MAQLVKNPPAMQETWVQPLGWEEPLENGKATHSSILAWRIPWGRKELDTTKRLPLSLSLFWGLVLLHVSFDGITHPIIECRRTVFII